MKKTEKKNKAKETIFIGVSWPYANGPLHLGHLAGQNIVCDVFARYHRQKGNEVLMVSGADAHGTPVTIKAKEDGIKPEEAAEKYRQSHLETFEKLNCEWDNFTTTETDNHKKVSQNLFKVMFDQGFIIPKEVEQYYDEEADKYLADRYITGTCPHCGYENARGDQCNDGCERMLEPTELIDPKSKLTGTKPVLKKHTILYFDLSQFQDQIEEFVENRKEIWRKPVYSVAKKWLNEGLQPRPVTRKLGYGVQVPIAEYNDQDIYVWFEAVMGYLSAAIEWAEKTGNKSRWEYFWKNPEAKHYYFIAKDNIPFHTFLWPSMILAYNHKYSGGKNKPELPGEFGADPLNLPYDVPANQFLSLEGSAISKSKGNYLTANDLLDEYETDLIRYFFTRHAPENHDKDFRWKDLIDTNNQELVATFGNFIHRNASFLESKFGGKLEGEYDANETIMEIHKTYTLITDHLENCRFSQAAIELMNLARFGNKYFNDEKPWETFKTNKDQCEQTIYNCFQIIKALGVLCHPFMPETSLKIHELVGEEASISSKDMKWDFEELTDVKLAKKPKVLFEKLEYPEIEEEEPEVEGVVVAKIVKVEPHPNADNLVIAEVDIGKEKTRQIVAGDKSLKEGQFAPYVKPGGRVFNKKGELEKIGEVTIQGVKSEGMLCSAREVGVGKDHERILVFKGEGERKLFPNQKVQFNNSET